MIYFVVIPVVIALIGSIFTSTVLLKAILTGFALFWAMTVGLTYCSNLILTTAKQTTKRNNRKRVRK